MIRKEDKETFCILSGREEVSFLGSCRNGLGLIPLWERDEFRCSYTNLCPRKRELCELKKLFTTVTTLEYWGNRTTETGHGVTWNRHEPVACGTSWGWAWALTPVVWETAALGDADPQSPLRPWSRKRSDLLFKALGSSWTIGKDTWTGKYWPSFLCGRDNSNDYIIGNNERNVILLVLLSFGALLTSDI